MCVSNKVKSRILSLLMFIIPVSLWAADDAKGKAQQVDDAYNAYLDALTYLDEQGMLHMADSIYQVGERQHNYRVTIFAYCLRASAYYSLEQEEPMQEALDQWKELATKNHDQPNLYQALETESRNLIKFDMSAGLQLANQMIQKADKEKFSYGQISGYQILGYIYTLRGNPTMALQKYQKALDIMHATHDHQARPDLIYLDMTQAYYDLQLYKQALQYCDSMENYVKTNPSLYTEINVWRTLITYKQKKDNATFFKLYNKTVADPNYQQQTEPDLQLQLSVYWLIRNKQFEEALEKAKQIEYPINSLALQKECMEAMGRYREATLLADSMAVLHDSVQVAIQTDDLNSMDAKMNNAELKRRNAEQQAIAEHQRARAQLILFVGIFTVLLVILAAGTIILIRRRHNLKVLEGKNEELRQARDEAETARDEAVTARDEAEVARHHAEQANEMKGHFIENMMHEIRTPLNAISGFSMLLTDPMAAEDPASMKEASDMISKNTQHLVHLLDDIIQISNYESLSVAIDMQDVSISEMVLTAIMNAPQVNTGVEIVPYMDNLSSDPMMFSSSDLIQRALGCLVNNAVKFTKQGTITIGADFDDQQVTYWVEDNGPGIPEGEEENIFQRFVKLDNFVPGTGLGLSLCRAVVTALKGEVRLDRSYAKAGSRFIIVIPRQLELLGSAQPKTSLQMKAPQQVAAPMMSEEEIRAFIAESGDSMSEEEIQALIAASKQM